MTVVQRSPNIGLAIRMQRVQAPGKSTEGETSTPPGDGELFGAGWLGGNLDAGTNLQSELLPDGRWEIRDLDRWRLESSIWVGTPVVLDADFQARPVPGPDFHCVELQVETTYYNDYPGRTYFGVVQGTEMVDARWTFEWDYIAGGDPAVSRQGHIVTTYGNVLHLRCAGTDTSAALVDTLVAWAYVDGAMVGQLTFRAVGIAA